MQCRKSLILAAMFVVGILFVRHNAALADFPGSQHTVDYEQPPINYSASDPSGPVVELQDKLLSGEIKLEHDPKFGYLPAVLKALDIPVSSQLLVFSKTSTHRHMIFTNTPRAIYFNDDVYVGWVPGAPLLEISSADPNLGAIFHGMDQEKSVLPMPVRTEKCLECHVGSKSMGVPGHLVRSFHNNENGWPNDGSGYPRISHKTKFEDRWGGWYITGKMEKNNTRANIINPAELAKRESDPKHQLNIEKLDAFFDTDRYLSPHSDMAAMLVLEHQTHMHNFIARLNYEARIFQKQYGHIRYVQSPIEHFVGHLLFVDEEPLPGPVRGTSDFVKGYESQGPFDEQGRSFRQFDLQTRLFKFPCSPLVYSDAFDAMTPPLKERVMRRLWEVLSGEVMGERYETLSKTRRRAILEILIATKPNLPDYWKLPE